MRMETDGMAAVQESVHGIVLSAMPVGETDRRIVLLTKERGKISAFARGARRQTSPLLAKCQPFATGEFTVYPGRDSYTVVQAEITEYFQEIQADLDAVCYGCYFCEFAGYFARENLEAGQLVNLLYLTLSMLVHKRFSYAFLRRIFELKVLGLEGEAPWTADCLLCHDKEDVSWFFYSRGGMLCENCAKRLGKQAQEMGAVRVEESVRYAITYVLASPLNRMYGFQVTKEAEKKICGFVGAYVRRTVQHEFKSLGILEAGN